MEGGMGLDTPDRIADDEYHLHELEIARTPGDPRRVMPPLRPGVRSVLDVGCGAGQTLIASDLGPGVLAVGVDVDQHALALGRRLTDHVQLAGAKGEALPFRDASFDMVICRVALPYMHVPTALAEMARVLRPGGEIWLTLHPASMTLRELAERVWAGDVRAALYRAYVLANGIALHLAGRQFPFPLGDRRTESFQTAGGMARLLRAAGFVSLERRESPFFVMTGVYGRV